MIAETRRVFTRRGGRYRVPASIGEPLLMEC
jgi:hypothetical protein